jgi:DNA repair photolyase
VRWDNLRLDVADRDDRVTVPLFEQGAVVRTFDTPEFRGVTFYEVRAKSIINRVPEASHVPFRWTINPYRGCQHACLYCFARKTHTYLDLDYGEDFDSRIVVKVNAPELLRKELGATRWRGEHIAMGTNVDPYQRAEGRYRLMRGILEALRDSANPFSILTKGTLILRDVDLLQQAATVTDVGTNLSVGCLYDDDMWRALEPGTPSPQRRVDAVRKLNEGGIPCGVLMAPIIPGIGDDDEHIDRTVRAIAEAGATHVSPIVLHLRTGAREWWMKWLAEHRPDLVPMYRELYGERAYAPKAFQADVADRVHAAARRFGIGRHSSSREARRMPEPEPEPQQLSF